MSITGATPKSRKQVSISLLNVGIVLKTDLADTDSPVNTVSMSGKAMGGLVVAVDADGSNPSLFMATSSSSNADWLDLIGTGTVSIEWDDIQDKPAVIAAGATAADARTAIGAGTSNLAIGTSSTTAMAGNKVPTGTQRGGVLQQAAIADLASGADAATIVTKVNALLAALRASGELAT